MSSIISNNNEPRMTGKERFRQQRSENLLSEDGWNDQAWYLSNRAGLDEDANKFKNFSQFGTTKIREHMVESEPPFYGEQSPWYATNNTNYMEGAYESGAYIPTHRDALLAQGEYTAAGLRETFKSRREHLISTPSCMCVGCKCRTCTTANNKGNKCSGCSCPNCSCKSGGRREHFMDNANSNMYATDPRFLVGAAELHFNVGSDVNDITRVYGTVDQRRYYPKITDYVNYGLTSFMETSN